MIEQQQQYKPQSAIRNIAPRDRHDEEDYDIHQYTN